MFAAQFKPTKAILTYDSWSTSPLYRS